MGLAATKQEAFWEACGFGNKDKVRRFILDGINVNWVSYTHNSCPIHVASQGKKEIVKMLLDAKCKVDARDDRDNTALHHAAMKGHGDIIQMLLDAGADVNAEDKSGWTPLINAAYYCHLDAVKVLLENKASFNHDNNAKRTALHETCRSPSTDEESLYDIAQLLINAGSDINSKSSDVGEADFTPLMFCAYHGHPRVAEALIKAGCIIDAKGSNDWTALHWAADRNQLKVSQVLLDSGLNPLLQGRRGELARDRARDNQLRELLSEAVDSANRTEEQLYSSNPSARPLSNQAKLERMKDSMWATAEGHRILVDQIEQRDRSYMSLTSRTPTSPNGSTSTRPLNDCDTTSSRSSSPGSDEEEGDGERGGKVEGLNTRQNGLVHVGGNGTAVANGTSKISAVVE